MGEPISAYDHPGATCDQMAGAVAYLRKEWGDYGYRLAYQGSDLFAVVHRDIDSADLPTFLISRYGQHYQMGL